MAPGVPMGELVKTLGAWTVSNYYVGPPGTLAPLHWDALDNVFIQLSGRKDLLVFSPTTRGIRPFPYDHPYHSRSQINLEAPDAAAAAELRGAGALAALGPGDGLYLPENWWHHVHAREDEGDERSVSLNFWFDASRELHDHFDARGAFPWPPTAPHMLHISREVEALAASVGARGVEGAAFFRSLRARLAGRRDDEGDEEVDEGHGGSAGGGAPPPPGGETLPPLSAEAVGMRNFLLALLVQIFGEGGALDFCDAFLDWRRFTRLVLKPVCFEW